MAGKSKPVWGLTEVLEFGSLSLHGNYTSLNFGLESEALSGLLGGLASFGAAPAPIGDQSRALVAKYRLNDLKLSQVAVGATYDPGNWFVMGEVVRFTGDGFLASSRSAYVSAGYRLGAFTPYLTYSHKKAKLQHEDGIASPDAAGLNAGLNAVLYGLASTQHTASAGVRWDFMKNVALKAQYDRITTGGGSAGRYRNVQPGFVPGKAANLVTAALDFVF